MTRANPCIGMDMTLGHRIALRHPATLALGVKHIGAQVPGDG